MTTCVHYTATVNGNKFEFALLCNSNDFFSPDGVIITPDADIAHPDFPEALNQIHKIFPYVRATEWVNELGDYAFAGYYEIEADLIVEAFEQGIIEIDLFMYTKAKYFQQGIWTQPGAKKPVHKKESTKILRGFVYLLKSSTGHYKIGRTANPKNRLKTFGVKLPFETEFIALIESENMFALEAELHERYAGKRVNGEWFDLSREDIEYIKGLVS